MRERGLPQLTARGARVLVVTFAAPERIPAYRAALELPFDVAADPRRAAYRAYGLLTGSRWRVWHPRVLWRYVELVRRGMRLQRPARGDDLSQLGGDFVLDATGRLVLAHVSTGPTDRPPVAALVAAARA